MLASCTSFSEATSLDAVYNVGVVKRETPSFSIHEGRQHLKVMLILQAKS